ncbi:MAG: cupin domain-containing protein [Candidatus Doudnabacteria bacterium]|nr:cupin domain-containing protein [Candidatus Doudnabacteria bacterium]
MNIYSKHNKTTPGWGYWGNYGEIDMGFSSGLIEKVEDYAGEPLHYHKKATTYMLVLDGVGLVEIDGIETRVEKESLLRIDPTERYRVLGAAEVPFRWIVVSTNKEPGDRVVVES